MKNQFLNNLSILYKDQIKKSFSDQLNENGPLEFFEKGGKRAQIGEIRIWGGNRYVKHVDGWIELRKDGQYRLHTGKKEWREVDSHHINHHGEHSKKYDKRKDDERAKNEKEQSLGDNYNPTKKTVQTQEQRKIKDEEFSGAAKGALSESKKEKELEADIRKEYEHFTDGDLKDVINSYGDNRSLHAGNINALNRLRVQTNVATEILKERNVKSENIKNDVKKKLK